MPGKSGFFQLQATSRQKKFDLFMELFQPAFQDLVLDLGGADGSFFSWLYPWPEQIVAMDIQIDRLARLRRSSSSQPLLANGTRLPFADKTFDILWSNAVIEHVGTRDQQKRLAQEIQRVASSYFVTTPWRGFPIELHYKLPLYQFVPKRLQRACSRRVAIGWYRKGEWEDINLLWQHQLQELFPEARVIKQRVTPWPETLIAFSTR